MKRTKTTLIIHTLICIIILALNFFGCNGGGGGNGGSDALPLQQPGSDPSASPSKSLKGNIVWLVDDFLFKSARADESSEISEMKVSCKSHCTSPSSNCISLMVFSKESNLLLTDPICQADVVENGSNKSYEIIMNTDLLVGYNFQLVGLLQGNSSRKTIHSANESLDTNIPLTPELTISADLIIDRLSSKTPEESLKDFLSNEKSLFNETAINQLFEELGLVDQSSGITLADHFNYKFDAIQTLISDSKPRFSAAFESFRSNKTFPANLKNELGISDSEIQGMMNDVGSIKQNSPTQSPQPPLPSQTPTPVASNPTPEPTPMPKSDLDNDGVPNDEDCAPNDPDYGRTLVGYLDLDHDGTVGEYYRNLCIKNPQDYPVYQVKGNDCDDNNSAVQGPQALYLDKDGDGYYGKYANYLCRNSTEALIYRYSVTVGTDCDDNDRNKFKIGSFCLDSDGDGYYHAYSGPATFSNACIGNTISGGASLTCYGWDNYPQDRYKH